MKLSEQNSETSLLLLAAQDRLYGIAKTNIWLLYLASSIPFFAIFLKPFFPGLENFLMVSGVLGLAIVLAMEKWTKKRIEQAARIQEEFDLRVFELSTNESLTGGKVSREIITEAAGTYRLAPERLPWYSAVIEKVTEPSVQILLCQRENAVWDWRARNYVARRLSYFLYFLVVLVFVIGILFKNSAGVPVNVWEWLLFVIVPASALLFKTYQLQQSFQEVGKGRQDLDGEITQEIESFIHTHVPIHAERLRWFQNKIYQSRLENCIVPDWLHRILQKGFQPQTTKSTEMLVKEILHSFN